MHTKLESDGSETARQSEQQFREQGNTFVAGPRRRPGFKIGDPTLPSRFDRGHLGHDKLRIAVDGEHGEPRPRSAQIDTWRPAGDPAQIGLAGENDGVQPALAHADVQPIEAAVVFRLINPVWRLQSHEGHDDRAATAWTLTFPPNGRRAAWYTVRAGRRPSANKLA